MFVLGVNRDRIEYETHETQKKPSKLYLLIACFIFTYQFDRNLDLQANEDSFAKAFWKDLIIFLIY